MTAEFAKKKIGGALRLAHPGVQVTYFPGKVMKMRRPRKMRGIWKRPLSPKTI